MEAFRAKVQAIQDQEAKVEKQFQSTSVAVDVHTFAALAEFPTNEQGTVDLQGIDEQRRRWGFELDVFFMIDTQCGGRAQVMWTHYLHIAFPFMMNWSLRDMLMALLLRVSFHRAAGRSWLQYVELFAGQGNLSKAAIRAGLSGVSLDKDYGEHQNILTGHGLVLALLALTATVPGALWWTGLPCSSFVILCVSVSQRCAENDFLGDESKDFVLEGNTIGDLSALLQFLAYMVQCNDGMEQPASSVYPETPCCKAVLRHIQAHKTVTYHWCFGGPTLKPLQLWSSKDYMKRMHRERPWIPGGLEALATRDERGGFTGNKERLRESQMYTPMFGEAVVKALLQG